ncbi:hypothetical protein [Ilumatobacter sp.]|uniref:hypothetical protein n=1 Tax=Ilumatobacter sp. TaxID=1967498 RepID=UPI003C588705
MAIKPSSFPPASRSLRTRKRLLAGPDAEHLRNMVETATIELVPMKSLDRAISELRPASTISMTCSPAKSIEATLDAAEELIAAGHRVTPHISARMVQTPDHLRSIHERLGQLGIREIFLVAGDASPPGYLFDAIEFLDEFLRLDDADGSQHRQIDHIGYTAYPDAHPIIPEEQLHAALHRKQGMILASGRTAHVSTQMCFSPDEIRGWLRRERDAGLTVPVHLGIPGVLEITKLMTTGMRLGVGPSLRYLSKNRRALRRLMTQRSFEPDTLLRPLASDLAPLGVDGIHLYTFNQVDTTELWRERTLTEAS